MTTLLETSDATISRDGLYRYDLTRRWERGPLACWIMLNPSTANGFDDDPTIRRVRSFTQRAGYPGFVVVNLFALRVTRPVHLLHHPDPIGPENNQHIVEHVLAATAVIAAWGASGALMDRAREVQILLEATAESLRFPAPRLLCLGHTKDDHPRHPLYVSSRQQLVEFEGSNT